MLNNRQVVLTKLPLNAISDAFIQSDNGSTAFKIKNARNVRNVKFSFKIHSYEYAIYYTGFPNVKNISSITSGNLISKEDKTRIYEKNN